MAFERPAVAVALDRYPHLTHPSRPLPWAWAEDAQVAALFEGHDVEVRLERRTWWFTYPSIPAALEFLEETSGPVQRLRGGVQAAGGDWGHRQARRRLRARHR